MGVAASMAISVTVNPASFDVAINTYPTLDCTGSATLAGTTVYATEDVSSVSVSSWADYSGATPVVATPQSTVTTATLRKLTATAMTGPSMGDPVGTIVYSGFLIDGTKLYIGIESAFGVVLTATDTTAIMDSTRFFKAVSIL